MNAEQCLIKPITNDNISACAELYQKVFSAAPWHEPWSTDTAFDRLACFARSEGFVGMVAERDEPVGLVLGNTEPFYCGTIFYLREMCVAGACQGQGIGKALYQALERKLKGAGVKRLYLTTDRAIPAAQFYCRQGFHRLDAMGFYAKALKP